MRQIMWVLLLTLGLFVSPTYAQPAKDQAPTVEFELRVGDTKYDVAEGTPFSIVTPKGERVELVLRRKEVLQFADHGASFNYDSAMKVEVAKETSVVTITLEATTSPLALIQIYSAAVSPDQIRGALLQGLRDEFKSRGAQVVKGSARAVRRQFRGVDREGQYLEYLFGGERMSIEIYAFQKGKTVMSIVLQHLASDAELAKRYFSVITNSLQ